MLNIKIKSIGTYIPKTTVTSGELEKIHNIPEGWIEKSTGIKTRRYIGGLFYFYSVLLLTKLPYR